MFHRPRFAVSAVQNSQIRESYTAAYEGSELLHAHGGPDQTYQLSKRRPSLRAQSMPFSCREWPHLRRAQGPTATATYSPGVKQIRNSRQGSQGIANRTMPFWTAPAQARGVKRTGPNVLTSTPTHIHCSSQSSSRTGRGRIPRLPRYDVFQLTSPVPGVLTGSTPSLGGSQQEHKIGLTSSWFTRISSRGLRMLRQSESCR
ncbi:uncharacterized protein B0H18DRAFT_1042992 [Fomitopsis serialis]|uniref:uncharacterized protein n=1 Tax=Fomitopsis serialis TaxID=139415 RepID=UPI0020081AFB|nr:uncharacterized protein B0H18DRAFT_1042992 [Neoantrodia serialis]KAH9915006.1 hypothetical protein B0H18DRAFT_1042992 [Neoantrodia serialis]